VQSHAVLIVQASAQTCWLRVRSPAAGSGAASAFALLGLLIYSFCCINAQARMSREITESFYNNHTREELIEEIVNLSSLNTTLLQENESLKEKNQFLEQENKNLEAINSISKVEAWNRNISMLDLRTEITLLKTEITLLKRQLALSKRQLADLHNPDAVVTPVVTPRMSACHNPYMILFLPKQQ
jgi:hypothetical protein